MPPTKFNPCFFKSAMIVQREEIQPITPHAKREDSPADLSSLYAIIFYFWKKRCAAYGQRLIRRVLSMHTAMYGYEHPSYPVSPPSYSELSLK